MDVDSSSDEMSMDSDDDVSIMSLHDPMDWDVESLSSVMDHDGDDMSIVDPILDVILDAFASLELTSESETTYFSVIDEFGRVLRRSRRLAANRRDILGTVFEPSHDGRYLRRSARLR